jgi:hypothetical protein
MSTQNTRIGPVLWHVARAMVTYIETGIMRNHHGEWGVCLRSSIVDAIGYEHVSRVYGISLKARKTKAIVRKGMERWVCPT